MISEAYKLADFLETQNAPEFPAMPWFHTTRGANLLKIMNSRKLTAMPCEVFHQDLTYFFVGRPAYKYSIKGQSASWQLPMVFVMKFDEPPPIARIYPFDSGAFTERRYPDYIQMFGRDRYLLGTDPASIQKLLGFYFRDEDRYAIRRANSMDDIESRLQVDARHDEIMALALLYQEKSNIEFDDRAAAVEVQVNADVSLSGGRLLGVILCEERLRTPGAEAGLRELTPNVITYPLLPNDFQSYFGVISAASIHLLRRLKEA